jgi:hypothetical protein
VILRQLDSFWTPSERVTPEPRGHVAPLSSILSCGQYTYMLFLSWPGQPLARYANAGNRNHFIERAMQSLQELHRSQVLHNDAELRNFVYNKDQDRLIVDLERAEMRKRDLLAVVSPNQNRKRNWLRRRGWKGMTIPVRGVRRRPPCLVLSDRTISATFVVPFCNNVNNELDSDCPSSIVIYSSGLLIHSITTCI